MTETKKEIPRTRKERAKHARVEYRANLLRIIKLTNEGYTKKAIHKLLYEEQLISMSYPHFCRFNSAGDLTRLPLKKKKTLNNLPQKIESNSESDFSFNNVVTDEDLEDLIG